MRKISVISPLPLATIDAMHYMPSVRNLVCKKPLKYTIKGSKEAKSCQSINLAQFFNVSDIMPLSKLWYWFKTDWNKSTIYVVWGRNQYL